MFRPNFRFLILTAIGVVCTTATVATLIRKATAHHPPNTITAQGYGGPIHLALTTDSRGHITALTLISHHDTPAYTGTLEPFLAGFIGKGPGDALEIGRDVDGITGATITGTAIADAVRAYIRKSAPEPRPTPRGWWIDLLAALFLLGLSLAALFRRDNRLRWLTMAAGFLYLGLIIRSMFSAAQPAAMALMSPPSIPGNPRWWIILTLAGLPAFILGRLYCSGACPFALVQELLYHLVHGRRRGPAEPKHLPLPTHLDRVKYILLIGILIICAASGNPSAAAVEPFITLFTAHGSTIAWIILILVLAASAVRFRFFCRVLCPAGALLGSYASLAPFKVTASPTSCTSCGDCARACPTGAIRSHKTGPDAPAGIAAEELECILCGHCLRACPSGALKIGRRS